MLIQELHGLSVFPLLIVLGIAGVIDTLTHRIPNWLTLGALFLALLMQLVISELAGLLEGLMGAAAGLLLLLPFYLVGGMGAGDVKLMAAIGAFTGTGIVLWVAGYGLMVGGMVAIALVIARGEMITTLQRYAVSAMARQYVQPDASSVTKKKFPFAASIAAGTVIALYQTGQLNILLTGSSQLYAQFQAWGAGL